MSAFSGWKSSEEIRKAGRTPARRKATSASGDRKRIPVRRGKIPPHLQRNRRRGRARTLGLGIRNPGLRKARWTTPLSEFPRTCRKQGRKKACASGVVLTTTVGNGAGKKFPFPLPARRRRRKIPATLKETRKLRQPQVP